MRHLPLVTFLLFGTRCALARTIYVTPSGTGAGSSWADAAPNIGTALNASTAGDDRYESTET